ncbi:MAG: phage baseplate assembly protein [Treponematales bacterium]
MMAGLSQIAAKIRNIFSLGEFKRRGDDGRIQVLMHDGMVVEKKEAFPYGFCAKAKNGKAFVLCQGGNMDGFEIFPVLIGEGVTPPELEEGDAALFTEKGGSVVLRDTGDVEISNADGDLWIICKKGGEVEIKGKIKITGGSLEVGGTASPSGKGVLCALPNCAFTGAPHVGNKAEGT